MKNLFLAAAIALGLLVSCNKEGNEIYETSKGAVATVSFTDEEPATRAFFGSTAAAETWEKTLNTVTIFVIDPSGDLLVKRSFSAAELSAKKAIFALPDAVPGTVCEFYAVANLDVADVGDKTTLMALLERDAASYNGTFAEVSAKAKRTGGFVMSGSASKAVAAAGSSTDVAITLKRTVAKVAIQVTPSPQFGSLYQGAVRINSITLSNGATQTPVFPTKTDPRAFNFSTTQASDAASGKYRNLFYLYESPARNVGSRVKATIDATYDMDGDFSTVAGQSSMTYEVELDGAVAAAGSSTDVAITLKRTVAKVAIQVTPSPQFGSLYQGAVRINSITLSNGATQTPVFPTKTDPRAFNFSTTQASDAASGKYRNLFYLYESPARNVGSRVKATIDATYDMDGDFSTVAGQSSMTYEVELDGASGGEIRRNGYYRVDITINGLSGHDASLTVTPAEWESPVTQTVELGA